MVRDEGICKTLNNLCYSFDCCTPIKYRISYIFFVVRFERTKHVDGIEREFTYLLVLDGFLVRFWCQDYQGCPRADAFLDNAVGCHGMDEGHDDLGFMGSIAGDFACYFIGM
jgi:hypothetical protein